MRAKTAMVRMFERAGFQLARWNGHMTWNCPCGHTQVTIPSSPGKGRSTQNTEALMNRTLRACKPPQQRRAA
jgi:predicted RNA binding protein YcfA (HicA-like mRNA interferase family)